MIEKEKVIEGLEETESMLTQAVDRGGEMAVMGAFKCLNRVTEAIALLKEQEAKWHIFHENEDGVMEVECSPNNYEKILWYRNYSDSISMTIWDDNEWAKYSCDVDGKRFEDGDAWMKLPRKPE